MNRFFIILCLVAALLLAGCARDDDGDPSDGNSAASGPVSTSARPFSDSPPSSLDPITTGSSAVASPDATEPAVTVSVTTAPITTPPITTSPVTTVPVTTPPVTTVPETDGSRPAVDPSAENFREESAILYAARALTLYQNGEKISVASNTALLCTGIGESLARVRWQGEIGYVSLDDITYERPQSADELAAEKGGIYYMGTGPLIAIDAGHQDHAMREKEPLGPGSDELKAKLSSGTQGVATRLEEYKLNLAVALLLRDELIGRGYSVVMIRETNNVEMSNSERALIANAYKVDAFIRIHANGSENSSAKGAYTICQTKKNPYNGDLYAESKRLAENILQEYIARTGLTQKSIWETDTMTGINWASVPVTLIEMGYMSNPDEDRVMATEEFQRAAAVGMADGFDLYFGRV